MKFVDVKNVKKSKESIGNMMVDVVKTPRFVPFRKRERYVKKIEQLIRSLLKGMRVTFNYLIRPSTVVTQQYPENRETLKMFDRYRSQLVFNYNEKNEHYCTACRICEKGCPNKSIIIHTRKGAITGKNELERYLWHWDSCTFCNACVQSCPQNAIRMTGNFESAVYDRRLLIYNLNSYAGPCAKVLDKIENEEDRQKAIEPIKPYFGNLTNTMILL